MLIALLQSLRPHQQVKNLLVFAPLVFSHRLSDAASRTNAGLAFLVLCMISSSVYLFNDVLDREADRQHPRKQHRPLAAGRLPVNVALVASAALMVASRAIAQTLTTDERQVPWVVWPAVYLLLNLAYSLGLKHIVIVDCLIIALGFMLRVHSGAEALPSYQNDIGETVVVESSSWILLCTFFFALFLAFCKRRDAITKRDDHATRATLQHYDLAYLDQVISPLAALSILSYALWTVSEQTIQTHGTRNLILTVPFVVFGVFRYQFLVHRRGAGEDPARILFRDHALLAAGLLYGLATWLILTLVEG